MFIIAYFIFQKKKSKEHSHSNKENMLGKRPIEATHSNFSIADDSNTCKIPKIHNNLIIFSYCNLIISQLNYNPTNFFFYIIIPAFSVSDSHSQEPTEFATQLGFSEDSNSQNSEPPPAKQIKTE